MKRFISLVLVIMLSMSMVTFGEGGYIVEEGDTLAEIAKMYGFTAQELATLNGIDDPNMIYPGDLIKFKKEYSTLDLNEQLKMATLWVQASAEFRAISYQTFNLAEMMIDKSLADDTITKPRAIVVDLDETILDNSPYEAWLIGMDFGYSSSTWNPWIKAGIAPAMPGAVDFLKYCESKDIEVFYVSNRKVLDDNAGYEGTVKNLLALGLPNVDEKHVLLRTGSSDKTERRSMAEKDNHIVLYMGDNLNDFLQDFAGLGVADRFAVTDMYKDEFGKKFIVMPNPMYGEWEGAIYKYNWGANAKEKDEMRNDTLRKWDIRIM